MSSHELRVRRLRDPCPKQHSRGPPIELRIAISADVELLGSVQTEVNKIGVENHRIRPFDGGIRENKRHVVTAEQPEKYRDEKWWKPHFETVLQGATRTGPGPGTSA